ncbi:MAG: hypothetical protein QOJ23_196 [Actinomycetota bacterium]|jgi:hypothetical protein|nr:hypothetical protein [Actinomycetota bacterium]
MVAAAFGLAVSWEDELSDRAPTGAGRDPYGRITPL